MIDYTEWLYQSLDYLQYVEMFEADFNWGDVLYAEPLNDDN